jgi:putative protein kinase ArgK-like GTPase of G3E family
MSTNNNENHNNKNGTQKAMWQLTLTSTTASTMNGIQKTLQIILQHGQHSSQQRHMN